MIQQPKILQWLKPALCGLALAGSASLGLAQGANDYIVSQFDDGTTMGWAHNYGGAVSVVEHDPNENRGPGGSPGALKVTMPFDLCTLAGNNQGDFEKVLADVLDLTKYTKLHFSVKVDPSSSRLSDWGGGAFGSMRPHIRLATWGGDSNMSSPDSQWVGTDAYGNWVDYTMTIDQTLNNEATRLATGILGYQIWSGWGSCAAPIGHTNTVIFWLDNVWFEADTNTAPVPPPTVGLAKLGPPGVQITVDDNGNQWQRDAIVTPDGAGVMWGGYGAAPVTYSFNIAEFPDPVKNEGFEAHLYIVNGDTGGGGNTTYGGTDWNVPDIAIVSIMSRAGGDYQAQFQFKTNRPNNNPLNDPTHIPASVITTEILGTWSVSFTHNTNVTLTGPGGVNTNFFIPEEAVLNNFSPATSYLQLGVHKNDNENDGHNNGKRATYTRFQKTGGDYQFDDNFNGADLTSNVGWRTTSATAVQHVPAGTGLEVNWTVPASGFNLLSAPAVTGPWNPAGASKIFQGGGLIHAYIPTSALPGANANYFRLVKRPFTKLQILLPGETAAPHTVSGKTGTPDAQGAGQAFNVIVNAVDEFWNVVPSTDTVNIASTDVTATLPADAALSQGTRTFSVTLNSTGNWTITASDVTDNTKTAATTPTIVIP